MTIISLVRRGDDSYVANKHDQTMVSFYQNEWTSVGARMRARRSSQPVDS